MGANLADLVRNSATRRPDHPAIITRDRSTTWAELELLVRALAGGLAERRLDRGDRVVIMLDNGVEFVAAYFGTLRAGMVAVPINTGYTASEVSGVIQSCRPRLVIADARSAPVVQQALVDGVGLVVVGTDGWRRLTVGSTPPPQDPTDPESLAVLLFTAGTSGQPRAAMLTHRSLIANLQQLSRLDSPCAMTADDVALMVLPLFHIYALNALLGLVAMNSATAVIAERFDPAETLELIKLFGVTNVGGAPPMYVAWSDMPEAAQALSGVRLLVSGSSPLPTSVFQQFATLGLTIWESYGMTEAAPAITSSLAAGHAKPGSVGQPLPGVDLRLLDSDGNEVDEGDPGEIVIRGPNLFSGYWPDASAGPDMEGWWPTGDVAVRDEEGDLRLVDRLTELVIVSGFNVYPREIESVLEQAPGVREVAVAGVDHPYTGEAVKAWVVLEAPGVTTPEDLVAFAALRLARFKCPSIIEIVAELPHSVAGKVSKAALRMLEDVR